MKFQIKFTQRLLDGFWMLVAQIQALDEICSFPVFFGSAVKKISSKTQLRDYQIDEYKINELRNSSIW